MGTASAQDLVQVQPVPLVQEGRFFPGFGNESLIVVRYTVKADGTTDDIKVLDGGLANPFLERGLPDIVSKWTFTPGTVNGEPADFLNQEYTFRIKLSEQLGSSADFQKEYAELDMLFNSGEYDKAKRMVTRILRQHVHTVLDWAVAYQTLSNIEVKMGDSFAALDAIRKATMSSVNLAGETEYLLIPNLLDGALRQRLVLAASLRQQAEVVRTWELLEANFVVPEDDRLREFVATARQQIESPDPLPLVAKIIDKQWTYAPVHRIFTVTNIEGRLNTINVRCEHRNMEIEYQPDVDWTLPPAFGSCELDFEGRDGTTFTVYEFKE